MATNWKELQLQLLVSEPFLEIGYIKPVHLIYYKWIGHIQDHQTKAGVSQILSLIKEKQAHNLVADLSEFKGRPLPMTKYYSNVLTDLAFDYGIRNIAIVEPESIFGKFVLDKSKGPSLYTLYQCKDFTTLANALEWITTI